MKIQRKTLNSSIIFEGQALHTGEKTKLTLIPSEKPGIQVVRTDIDEHFFLSESRCLKSTLGTTLGTDTCSISTVEHLLAALHAYEITDLIIELNGTEVPLLDGSALPYSQEFINIGVRNNPEEIEILIPRQNIEISEGDKYLKAEPHKSKLEIKYEIDGKHPALKDKSFTYIHDPKIFHKAIAPARTYGFVKDVEMLRAQGFAKGASLNNVIGLTDNSIMNEGGLRFPDELIRHKILDILGDLYSKGTPLRGIYTIKQAGHTLHQKLLNTIIDTL